MTDLMEQARTWMEDPVVKNRGEHIAQIVAIVALTVFLVAGIYSVLAAAGVVPAMPWSALG